MAETHKRRTRKLRSTEEKIDALTEVKVRTEAGESKEEAANAVDVPRQTINSWIDQGLMQAVIDGTNESAYRRLKVRMLNDFALTAQKGLGAVNTLLDRANSLTSTPKDAGDLARAAREAAVALGIATDKVMLLTGQATSRAERVNVDQPTDLQASARAILNAVKQSSGAVIEAEYSVKQASSDNVDSQRSVEDKPTE